MQTGGGPPGEWSQLIVGHQWPSEMTIAGLNAWIENRGQIANAHHNIADLLNAAKTGPLAVQEGKTADSLVQLFDEGEQLLVVNQIHFVQKNDNRRNADLACEQNMFTRLDSAPEFFNAMRKWEYNDRSSGGWFSPQHYFYHYLRSFWHYI